jgi:hypothetical protein
MFNYDISLSEGYSSKEDVNEVMKYKKISADLFNYNGMNKYGNCFEKMYFRS